MLVAPAFSICHHRERSLQGLLTGMIMWLWATWSSGKCPCPWPRGSLKVSSNPNRSPILWLHGAASLTVKTCWEHISIGTFTFLFFTWRCQAGFPSPVLVEEHESQDNDSAVLQKYMSYSNKNLLQSHCTLQRQHPGGEGTCKTLPARTEDEAQQRPKSCISPTHTFTTHPLVPKPAHIDPSSTSVEHWLATALLWIFQRTFLSKSACVSKGQHFDRLGIILRHLWEEGKETWNLLTPHSILWASDGFTPAASSHREGAVVTRSRAELIALMQKARVENLIYSD